MGMPVSPSAIPRAFAVPTEGGTPRPFVVVDGTASAGSKHLLGAADALAEQTRLQFLADENVRTLVVHAEQGQGSHAWSAMVTIDPGDDIVAADNFNAATPDISLVLPNGTREFNLSAGTVSVYVLAIPAQGATAASCIGRIWVEAKSHA